MTEAASTARAADPRPARTRAAIVDAVEALCREGAEVTVSAVLRASGVSRGAFYAQFTDLEDVALEMLTGAFQSIGEWDTHERLRVGADPEWIAREALGAFASYIDARRTLFTTALDWKVSSRVREAVTDAFAAEVRQAMRLLDVPATDGEADDLARFAAGGTLAVLVDCLRADEPAERIAARLFAVQPDWLVPRRRAESP